MNIKRNKTPLKNSGPTAKALAV
ncbi:MAG: hypothetical protein ACD_7C00223G0007, partial [uncultured bacterium]